MDKKKRDSSLKESRKDKKTIREQKTTRERTTVREKKKKPQTINTQQSCRGSVMDNKMTASQRKKRGKLRNILMKVKDNLGHVETTPLPKYVSSTLKEVDAYYNFLGSFLPSICRVFQQHPKMVPDPIGNMEVEYRPNTNPFELLEDSLRKMAPQTANPEATNKLVAITHELGVYHRDNQKMSRKALHKVRTFYSVEYPKLSAIRLDINAVRQEMDYAKHELQNTKNEEMMTTRQNVFKEAEAAYNKQVDKITNILKNFEEQKKDHFAEFIAFIEQYKKYHDVSLAAIQKIQSSTTKLG